MEVEAEDGRIELPDSVRNRYGETFELIVRRDRIILVPAPDDSLTALREE